MSELNKENWTALMRRMRPDVQVALERGARLALSLWQPYLGIEHVTIALASNEQSLTVRALLRVGLKPSIVVMNLMQSTGAKSREPARGVTPTPRLFKILEKASALARSGGSDIAGEREVLLTLLNDADCLPTRVLKQLLDEQHSDLVTLAQVVEETSLEPPSVEVVTTTEHEEGGVSQLSEYDLQASVGLAGQMAEEGRFAEAFTILRLAIQRNPNYAPAHNNLGRILEQLSRPQEALTEFERAAELDPQYFLAIFNCAATLHSMGRAEEAMKRVQRALEINPDHAGSHALLGNILSEEGLYAQALKELDRALDLNPKLQWALTERGMLHSLALDFKAAEVDLSRALGLNSEDLRALRCRATVYRYIGRNEEALQDLDHAVTVAEETQVSPAPYYAQRGQILVQQEKPQHAIADLKKAIALGQDDADVHKALGSAMGMLGRYEEARREQDRAIELQRDDAELYYERAITHTLSGNYAASLEDLNEAIRLRPDWQYAYLNRSNAHHQLGHQAAALEDLQKALELDPADPKALYNLASYALGAGEKDEAIELLERCVQLGDMRAAEVLNQLKAPVGTFDLVGVTFAVFAQAQSPSDLQEAVAKYPLMTEPRFIDAAMQKLWAMPPEEREAYQRRIAWLREIHRVKATDKPTQYHTGDKIGGQYLVFEVKRGGMGEVYLCFDLKNSEPYALKTVQKRYINDPMAHARFSAEARNWIDLGRHPHIVRCYSLREIEHQDFLILEWVKGTRGFATDLGTLLQQGPMDVRHALELAIQVARGLVYVSEKMPGLVHGDLTPGNILISEGYVAKITDFGLAQVSGEAHEGVIAGTSPYMAPEQWRGDQLDARTDIYAFGCLLYHMLTGNPPFAVPAEGVGDPEIRLRTWRQMHEMAARPHLREALPTELDEFIRTCLSKAPSQRYPKVQSMLAALIQAYSTMFGQAPPELPQEGDLTSHDLTMRANAFYQMGRYEEALADHNRVLNLIPDSYSELSNRGNVYTALGRTEEALADYQRAIELNSDYAPVYLNRANLYFNRKRYADALSDADKGIGINEQLKELHVMRGLALHQLGRLEEARVAYERALQLDPLLSEAYLGLGGIFADQGEMARAEENLSRAIELNPLSAGAFNRRGMLRAIEGRFLEAFVDFDKALELDPKLALAYVNRGLGHHAAKRYAEALADFNQAIELDPELAIAFMARSVTRGFTGKFTEAVEDASRAIELNPNLDDAYAARAAALGGLSQYQGAADDIDAALKIDPDNTRSLKIKAELEKAMEREHAVIQRAYLRDSDQVTGMDGDTTIVLQGLAMRASELAGRDKREEARALLDRAIAIAPKHPGAYLQRGHLLFDEGRYGEALEDYDTVLRIDSNVLQAHSSRANALTKLGRFEEALINHSRAIELDPQHAMSYLNRGGSYAAMGDRAQAKADWKRAIELAPELTGAHSNLGMMLFEEKQFYQALPHLLLAAKEGDPRAREAAGGANEILNTGLQLIRATESPESLLELTQELPFLLDPDFLVAITRPLLGRATEQEREDLAARLGALWLTTSAQTSDERRRRGQALVDLRMYAHATGDFAAVLEGEPNDQMALIGQACAFYNLREYDRAIAACDRLLRLNENHSQAHYFKALALGDSQGIWAALPELNRTIELAPDFSEAYLIRAMLRQFGDTEGALADAAKAEALGNPQAAQLAAQIKGESKRE